MIRAASRADIPFMLAVAREGYDQPFDERAAAEFLTSAIDAPHMLVARGERGAVVATISRDFWSAHPKACILFVVARRGAGMAGEGLRLMRFADAWRRAQGADSLHFGEDTGIKLAPLAKRLGAVQDRPSFVIRGGAAAVTAPAGATLLERMLRSNTLLGATSPRLIGG